MTPDEIDPRIVYHHMTEPAPSEAVGFFDGFSFDFYARHEHCTFTISRTKEIEAILVSDLADYDLERTQSPEYPSPAFPDDLVAAYNDCFHIERKVPGGKFAASYLDAETKKQYIREFCALFDQVGRTAHKELLPRIDWSSESEQR
jgi:hypothetical protein